MLTHLDKKLNILYNKISEYDSEAIVILHSDHGINFMTQTKELLSKEREKVIFLYKNNKKLIYSNDIKEIRELQSIPIDPNKPEDVDTKASDHAYDALRYLIMSRPQTPSAYSEMREIKRFAPSDPTFGY